MELLVLKDRNATSLLLLQMGIEEFLTCKHTAWRKNEALAQASLNIFGHVQMSQEDEEMPSQHSVDLDVKTQRHVPWVFEQQNRAQQFQKSYVMSDWIEVHEPAI